MKEKVFEKQQVMKVMLHNPALKHMTGIEFPFDKSETIDENFDELQTS